MAAIQAGDFVIVCDMFRGVAVDHERDGSVAVRSHASPTGDHLTWPVDVVRLDLETILTTEAMRHDELRS